MNIHEKLPKLTVFDSGPFCCRIRPVKEMKGLQAIPTSLALYWDTMANQPLN